MKEELLRLQKLRQEERQEIARRLKEIDEDLASIERVLVLAERQERESNQSQLSLIKRPRRTKSNKFVNVTFREAVKQLFADDPGRFWTPKEIKEGVLSHGYPTKSKNFGATVRSQLQKMREDEVVSATKTNDVWLYSAKEKGSTTDNGEEPNHGDVGERSSQLT